MKTAIIIPAYNEEKTILGVIKNAKKYGTVIVVDDCSHDATSKISKQAGAIVLRHEKNRGLGGALRTGFSYVIKNNFDVIVTIDADGQHRAEEIPKFLQKIDEGYDFVLGRRDLHRYPFLKKFGNFFLNMATNFISGTVLFDTESGFRAFTKNGLKKLYLRAERYEIAVEIIFEVGRNRLRCANVDIESPLYRKGVSFWDGINNFRYLLQRRKRNFSAYMEDFEYVMKNTARVLLNS
jgi:glycosyltransferase involved in cell wall biosynthesis